MNPQVHQRELPGFDDALPQVDDSSEAFRAKCVRDRVSQLTWNERQELRRAWMRHAKRCGFSTARTEMRRTLASLVWTNFAEKRGGAFRPVVITSDMLCDRVIEDCGPKWGTSRSTADNAFYDLRAEGCIAWPEPGYLYDEDGVCTGRTPRQVWPGSELLRLCDDVLDALWERVKRATAPARGASHSRSGISPLSSSKDPSSAFVDGTAGPPPDVVTPF